jgi:hypothetical protein
MTKKLIFITVALLLATVFLAKQFLTAIRSFDQKGDLKKLQVAYQPKPPANPKPIVLQNQVQAQSNQGEYQSIVSQNLFSDTRSNISIEIAPVIEEAPPLRIKPILLGVMVNADESSATILDPSDASGNVFPGKRRGRKMRIGDDYQGYTLAEIAPDKIVLKNGSRTESVMLGDNSKQRMLGQRTQVAASRVVNFGSPKSAPGAAANQRPGAPIPVSMPGQGAAAGMMTGEGMTPQNIVVRSPMGGATISVSPSPARGRTDSNPVIINTPNGQIMAYPPP